MIKERILSWIICIGWAGLIGSTFVFLLTFIYAYYFNDYEFFISLNLLKEAKIELALFLILIIPAMVYTFIYEMKNMETPYYKRLIKEKIITKNGNNKY